MKRFVALLLCLSLSIFTIARAMKPGDTLAAVAKIDQEKPTGQKADVKTLLNDANKALAALVKAYDDSMEDASDDDEGEDISDDDVVAMMTEAVMMLAMAEETMAAIMVAVTKAIKRVRFARTLSRLLPGRPIDKGSTDFPCL
jgi:hypothetical protein